MNPGVNVNQIETQTLLVIRGYSLRSWTQGGDDNQIENQTQLVIRDYSLRSWTQGGMLQNN